MLRFSFPLTLPSPPQFLLRRAVERGRDEGTYLRTAAKQRRGSFLLEAAVVLLLLMGAAGSIAHFASVTARARQQQWSRFQQEAQLDNVVERLQHVAPAQRETMADQLMQDENYGRPRIEVETIEVNGVTGQHVVITPEAADSQGAAKQTEFWRFDAVETEPDDSDAGDEGEGDDV